MSALPAEHAHGSCTRPHTIEVTRALLQVGMGRPLGAQLLRLKGYASARGQWRNK